MNTITLPKIKYQDLKKKAQAYEVIVSFIQKDFFVAPPIKDTKKIIGEFKKTGLYNEKFIESLKNGLGRSSYFKTK